MSVDNGDKCLSQKSIFSIYFRIISLKKQTGGKLSLSPNENITPLFMVFYLFVLKIDITISVT